MGTRSLTVFLDDEGKQLAVLYRQYDGYEEGHGRELREIVGKGKLVSGFTSDHARKPHGVFNGMGDLACRVIAGLKRKSREPSTVPEDAIGGFYLLPLGSQDLDEEYIYTLAPSSDGTRVTITVDNEGVIS